jgi:hypothetical protein
MRSPVLAACTLTFFAAFSLPAAAEWQVVRVSGAATAARSGEAPSRLVSGTTVPDAVTIETGSNGRVMLTRGTSRIMVAPRSSMTLDEGLFGTTTTVLQRVGQIDFQVEKRDVRYFAVETPSLIAAVKGTRFSVHVSGGRTNVGVNHGLVGVTDLATGGSADIASGQRASTRGHGLNLSGRGTKPAITRGRPRPARVQAMTAQAVSAEVRNVATPSSASPTGSRARSDDNNVSNPGPTTSNAPGRSGGRGGRGGDNGSDTGNGTSGNGNSGSHGGGHGNGGGGDH